MLVLLEDLMNTAASGSGPTVAGPVLALTTLLTVLLVAFTWPASELEPRDLPVAVVGPPGVPEQVESRSAGALDTTALGTRAEAVAAIEQREVYGALVMSASRAETLVASAASPLVATLLREVGAGMSRGATRTTDVVPLPPGDPRGVVFGAGTLPLVIGGIATAALLALRVPGRWQQVTGAAGVAAGAGLALTGVLQYWFDALAGSYPANASVVAVGLGAMALAGLGLHRVLGAAGLGVAAATFLLLGNPLSAVTSAPEMLPGGWNTLGQLLPPGATATALRSTAFFDGAAATAPLLVLGGWALLGAVLLALPPLHSRRGRAVHRTSHPAGVRGRAHAVHGG
jgi:hypothetical protein